MASDIKGFRLRRKAARVHGEGDTHTLPDPEEKMTIAQRAQQWLSENPRKIRNGILILVGVTAVVVLLVVLRAAAKDEHSRQLHTALEKYDQIKILPKGDARSAQMKDFGLSLKAACEQKLHTLESAAVCFTAGNALIEGREFKTAAEFFGGAAAAYDSEALISVARFMQAQALESAKDFEKALAVYKELEKSYTSVKKGEAAIFHQGRMLYYLGRYDDAEERFAKLSRESEGKEFAAASRNYISLLNSERAQQKAPGAAEPKK